MAKYYNTSNGSLAVSLRGGGTASLSGKSWTEIAVSDEGSEDLLNFVRKGFLVRSAVDDAPAPEASVAPVEAEVPVEKVESALKFIFPTVELEAPVVAETDPSEEADKSSDKPSDSRRKKGN